MTDQDLNTLQARLAAARGERPVDLVLKGGTLLNVLSGAMEPQDIAVFDGVVVGFGTYDAEEVMDVTGSTLCPAFWDSHFHLESSMLTPSELARVMIPAGTGTIVVDPHEIANVLGVEGIRFLLEASENLPLDVYFMLPSCVPASHMETAGAVLEAEDLAPLKNHPRVLGLAEVMNFPGVVHGDESVLKKITAFTHMVVDGHAPLLDGKALNAYLTAGIGSDHECTQFEEARSKLSKGMHIMIRQGTLAKNLKDLLPLVTPQNVHRFLLVTDDRSPEDLLECGHINGLVRQAVMSGLDPLSAVQMATINAAEYFGFRHRGAIAPGFQADIVVLEDPEKFTVKTVVKKGRVVWHNGAFLTEFPFIKQDKTLSSMHVRNLTETSFQIPARGEKAQVMELVSGGLITGKTDWHVKKTEGLVEADPGQDVLKVAVVERHKGTGNVGLGLVRGFGLKRGALCSSVAHDSHNLIVVGVYDSDLLAAVRVVIDMGGGLAAVEDGRVAARLALPIAGLISDRPTRELVEARRKVVEAAHCLGCPLEDPFMAMSFLALPVIPSLKITDRGLVDVEKFSFTSLFLE